jgi:AcrR family transcriptional regulator
MAQLALRYEETTVDHIVAAAGVSRRTFFRHLVDRALHIAMPERDSPVTQREPKKI